MVWAAVPLEAVTSQDVKDYIDILLEKRLSPQTINAHLIAIRRFYSYLRNEEGLKLSNPSIKGLALRLPSPLLQHLRDSDVEVFLDSIKKDRDMAIFMLMLRCGLRVEEVAHLTPDNLISRDFVTTPFRKSAANLCQEIVCVLHLIPSINFLS